MLNATEIAVQDTGLEPEDWLPEDKKSLSEAEKNNLYTKITSNPI